MAGIAYTIREKGREAMAQKAIEFNQQYNAQKNVLYEKQSEAASWKTYMEGKFAQIPPNGIDTILKAAIAWRNGDGSYYSYIARR